MGIYLQVCLYTTFMPSACGGLNTGFPITQVKDDYELPYLCWELYLGHLEK